VQKGNNYRGEFLSLSSDQTIKTSVGIKENS